MAIKKRTDQLPAILSGDVDNNDLMYLVHENAQAETGYDSKKIFVSDVGRKLNNGVEYATELPSFPPGDQNPLDALEYLNSKINDLYPVDSASGSIANFTTSLALPLVALKTYIQAQGGGGTPQDEKPIIGFSEVNVTRAGVNIWNEDWENGLYNNSDGTKQNNVNRIRSKGYIPCTPDMAFFAYYGGGDNSFLFRFCFYDKNKTFLSALNNKSPNAVYTVPSGAYYMTFCNLGADVTTYGDNISINNPSTVTTYVPYNADTFTLPLGQTIYGGYVDWKNGKVVVTYGSVDLGSLDWRYNSNQTRFDYDTDIGIKKPLNNNTPINGICEIYAIGSANNLANFQIGANTNGYLRIKDNRYTSYIDLIPAISGYKLIYELATPIELDLPTTMPSTIEGVQNWFADSGDIELEYKMGVQEYIDKKIAEIQALIL